MKIYIQENFQTYIPIYIRPNNTRSHLILSYKIFFHPVTFYVNYYWIQLILCTFHSITIKMPYSIPIE